MCAEPHEWNVVIAGAWNVAILTPDGIKKRLFRTTASKTLRVDVAIDTPGYFRVIEDGIIVIPSSSSLQVLTQRPDKKSLQKAAELASVALTELDQTPVVAAGVNIKYRFPELSNHLIDLIVAPVDEAFSDDGFVIKGKSLKRALAVGEAGVVNLEITQDESQAGSLTMNFHLASTKPEDLKAWLAKTEDFLAISERLLSCMKVQAADQQPSAEETPND
jgi:hypothetical protein